MLCSFLCFSFFTYPPFSLHSPFFLCPLFYFLTLFFCLALAIIPFSLPLFCLSFLFSFHILSPWSFHLIFLVVILLSLSLFPTLPVFFSPALSLSLSFPHYSQNFLIFPFSPSPPRVESTATATACIIRNPH